MAGLGEGRTAVAVVGEAEVETAEDGVFATVAVGGEGAATRAAVGGNLGVAGVELAGGNRDGFWQRLVGHSSLQKKENDRTKRKRPDKRKRPHGRPFYFSTYKFRISD